MSGTGGGGSGVAGGVAGGGPAGLLVRNFPGRRTVFLGVRILHGAAHDEPALAGATHLVEHLMLRRCGGRGRRELARLVDRLGGGVDAWTSVESMGLSVETTADALDEACELVTDAVLAPTFDPADVELERRVARAELALARSDPEDRVEELLLAAAWGRHPLARPVIGDEASLARLDPETLRRHHAGLIRPGSLLVTVAGGVDAGAVARLLARLPMAEPPRWEALPPLRWRGGAVSEPRAGSDQVHARLGFPAPALGDPAEPTLMVLDRILGVGASSRLFQRLREEEGLTYDVFSGLVLRRPGGLLEIGWATGREALADTFRVVMEELDRLAGTVSADEVAVAVEALTRGLAMDAEDPAGRAALEADELLERGRRFDPAAVVAELERVTPAAVAGLARRVLDRRRMATAVCGPEGVAELVA